MNSEEIDWSKAPEGAIGALIAKPECVHFPGITFVAEVGEYGCMIRGKACDGGALCAPRAFWKWLERPAKQWNGEGLPPVGARCEYFDGGDWMPCEVVAHRNNAAVVLSDHYEADFVLRHELRPIRTPEQIAAQEREAEIITLATLLAGHQTAWETQRETAAYLYDAGYRKVEGGAQ